MQPTSLGDLTAEHWLSICLEGASNFPKQNTTGRKLIILMYTTIYNNTILYKRLPFSVLLPQGDDVKGNLLYLVFSVFGGFFVFFVATLMRNTCVSLSVQPLIAFSCVPLPLRLNTPFLPPSVFLYIVVCLFFVLCLSFCHTSRPG